MSWSRRCHRARARARWLAIAVLVAWSARARAGGIENSVPGARGLGRAGASIASALGSDALVYNPARLALGDEVVAGADGQIQWDTSCFRRAPQGDVAFPRVCNAAAPDFSPQLALRLPIAPGLGLGLGLLFPAGASKLRFGDLDDGTLPGPSTTPSPARYSVVGSANTAVFPTLGIGFAPTPRLRLGASLGWGVFVLRNVQYVAAVPGDDAALDTRVGLGSVDRFVPRIHLAADFQVSPVFSLAVSGTWTDDVHADTHAYFSGVVNGQGFSHVVRGAELTQPLGAQAAVAARFASEGFDAELDLLYQANGRTRDVALRLPADARLPVEGTLAGQDLGALPESMPVARHWRDQVLVRLGGDIRVAERVSLRSGISYESPGVEHGYESVDNLPLRSVGMHMGVSVRATRWVELTAGYSHVFRPTTRVAPDDARIEQAVGAVPPGQTVPYVNAGRYAPSLDLLGVSIRVAAVRRAREPGR